MQYVKVDDSKGKGPKDKAPDLASLLRASQLAQVCACVRACVCGWVYVCVCVCVGVCGTRICLSVTHGMGLCVSVVYFH